MFEEAKIEKIRLESKLGISTVTTFKSTQSVAERDEDKANWQGKLARAQADMAVAAPGSIALKRVTIERDDFKLKLDKIELSELTGGADPQDVVDGIKMIKRTQALLEVEIELIAELEVTLATFPA